MIDLKDLEELYFIYVCTKDPKLSREKDEKRFREKQIKLGLWKKKKKGQKARTNKRKEGKM